MILADDLSDVFITSVLNSCVQGHQDVYLFHLICLFRQHVSDIDGSVHCHLDVCPISVPKKVQMCVNIGRMLNVLLFKYSFLQVGINS